MEWSAPVGGDMDRMAESTVLVVGDVMLDRYLHGEVDRISPEAPVPVVRVATQRDVAGGAANVAANLAGLGAKPRLLGAVGDDGDADRLRAALGGVEHDLVVRSDVPTIVKTRVIGMHQQMLRFDREEVRALEPGDEDALLARLGSALEGVDAVVVSDYGKGVVTERVAGSVIDACRVRGLPVIVDPKGSEYGKYAGATAVTPNLRELRQVLRLEEIALNRLLDAAAGLRASLQLDALVATLGEKGIELIRETGSLRLPAMAQEVFDVSGAGDTVVAVIAAALGAGLPIERAVAYGNTAAGTVVAREGTVPVDRAALRAALEELDDATGPSSALASTLGV